MTAQEVIERALRLLGVYDTGGSPSTEELNDSLESMNSLCAFWGSQSWCVPGAFQTSASLVAGDGSYTIGASQDINIVLPTKIRSAWVRDSSGIDSALDVIQQQEYAAISDKSAQGQPEKLCMVRTGATGTVYLWPVPDTTDTLYIEYAARIGNYALSDPLGLPQEYERPLAYNLAIELCMEYGVEPSQVLYTKAEESLAALKSANAHPVPTVFTDLMGINNPGRYNAYTDR